MVPKLAFPPIHHHPHLTKSLTPSEAQTQLAAFLTRTQTAPYLHPDSLLSTSGITYSVQSGPNGGLSIHHLRRIEAGLRGENFALETEEELARFTGEELPDGDDTRVDAVIRRAEKGRPGKRRRGAEEIERWAETSSQAGAEAEERADGTTGGAWQDPEEYEREQEPLEGELGERDGAPVARQNGEVPDVVEHDEDGEELRSGKAMTQEEKLKRKEAKKARNKAKKQKLARQAASGQG